MNKENNDSTLGKANASNFVTREIPREEETRSIMTKEIDSMERHIRALHMIAPWNETLLGISAGLFFSGIFGIFSISQSPSPIWVVVGTWVLTIVGLTTSLLCLAFRKSTESIESDQKKDLLDELERWKRNNI